MSSSRVGIRAIDCRIRSVRQSLRTSFGMRFARTAGIDQQQVTASVGQPVEAIHFSRDPHVTFTELLQNFLVIVRREFSRAWASGIILLPGRAVLNARSTCSAPVFAPVHSPPPSAVTPPKASPPCCNSR